MNIVLEQQLMLLSVIRSALPLQTIFDLVLGPTRSSEGSVRSIVRSLVIAWGLVGIYRVSIFRHSADDILGSQETICVLVAHNVQKGEWACQVPFFPPHQTAEVSFCAFMVHHMSFTMTPLVFCCE